jgi:pantetheine-phosphate adenylyltransferase
MDPTLETVFLTAAEEFSYVSSRMVKDIARLGGAVDSMVPPLVKERLHEKLRLEIKKIRSSQAAADTAGKERH